MLSCKPAHAARRNAGWPRGSRSSSAAARRRKARISERVSFKVAVIYDCPHLSGQHVDLYPRCPTPGSAASPQNHPLPGEDRLNYQRLLRPKFSSGGVGCTLCWAGRRTAVATHHNLQDERPLPTPPLSPTQPPHFGRDLYRPRPLPTTTTCMTNGRYPHHLSHQRDHLNSAAL
jgi:hypothetical protein